MQDALPPKRTECILEKSAILYSNGLHPIVWAMGQCSVEYKASLGPTAFWLIVSRSASAADVHVRYVAS